MEKTAQTRYLVRVEFVSKLLNSTTALGLIFILGLTNSVTTRAAQFGIVYPSHRFPTDLSFHASYQLGLGSSSSNYLTDGTSSLLDSEQSISWQKNSVQLEYQPSNHFSFGGHFTFQRTSKQSGIGSSVSKWTLGDQSVFAEYRFIDGPGYSLGLSGVIKFPGYSNDTLSEAQAQNYTLLPGDAQTDMGGMLSGEFWPAKVIRLQGDFGYLFRTQSFSDELIYQGSVGFVIPRVDLSLKIIGFHSIESGPTPGSAFDVEINTLKGLFAGSNYAYSATPSLMALVPKAEFWIGPEYAFSASLTKPLRGTDSAGGHYYEFGFIYRFSERRTKSRRSFTEVDIKTDQNAGVFEGELQEKNQRKSQNTDETDSDSEQNLEFDPLFYESAE